MAYTVRVRDMTGSCKECGGRLVQEVWTFRTAQGSIEKPKSVECKKDPKHKPV